MVKTWRLVTNRRHRSLGDFPDDVFARSGLQLVLVPASFLAICPEPSVSRKHAQWGSGQLLAGRVNYLSSFCPGKNASLHFRIHLDGAITFHGRLIYKWASSTVSHHVLIDEIIWFESFFFYVFCNRFSFVLLVHSFPCTTVTRQGVFEAY